MTDISRYLDFVLSMMFAFSFAFEIPVFIFLLIWSGTTDSDTLRSKRPYVVIGCFAVGMLLTPPDVISQILLALPIIVLYEISIIFSKFLNKS